MTEFKVGDVVEIKSGGPAMTIMAIPLGGKGTEALCRWQTSSGMKTEPYPLATLKIKEEQL